MSFLERLLGALGAKAPAPDAEPSRAAMRQEILRVLADRCAAAGERSFAYRSEWAGYFPNPLVHWVEVAGDSVSEAFPRRWERADLDALADAGAVRRQGEHTAPDDEYDLTVTYELASPVPDEPAR